MGVRVWSWGEAVRGWGQGLRVTWLPDEPGGMSTASATRQSTASWHCDESEPKGPTVEPSR